MSWVGSLFIAYQCSECDGIRHDAGEREAVSKLEKTGLEKLLGVFKK